MVCLRGLRPELQSQLHRAHRHQSRQDRRASGRAEDLVRRNDQPGRGRSPPGNSAIGSHRTPQPNKIVVFGKCRSKDGPVKVAIEKPGGVLRLPVGRASGPVGDCRPGQAGREGVQRERGVQPLVEFITPLADVLNRANTDSLGLAAEALLKTIDARGNPGGKNGGWAGGREMIARYLTGLGIPAGGVQDRRRQRTEPAEPADHPCDLATPARSVPRRQLGAFPGFAGGRGRRGHDRQVLQRAEVSRQNPRQDRLHQRRAGLLRRVSDGSRSLPVLHPLQRSQGSQPRRDQRRGQGDHRRVQSREPIRENELSQGRRRTCNAIHVFPPPIRWDELSQGLLKEGEPLRLDAQDHGGEGAILHHFIECRGPTVCVICRSCGRHAVCDPIDDEPLESSG